MRIDFLKDEKEWNSREINDNWKKLIENNDNLNVLFQSPDWFNHLYQIDNNSKLLLGVAYSDEHEAVGFIPLRIGPYNLYFDLKLYNFCTSKLETIFILGSVPILPSDPRYYDQFFDKITTICPDWDCLYLDSVPIQSYFWKYLINSKVVKDHFLFYTLDGIRPFYYKTLPTSFEEYIKTLKRSYRKDFKRKLKIINSDFSDDVKIVRIENSDEVPIFLEKAVDISRKSWQYQQIGGNVLFQKEIEKKLGYLAQKKILRSYLLTCHNTPIAYLLGYNYLDTFMAAEIAYDLSYSKYSPGIIMLFLILKDLIEHHPVKIFHFGVGDAYYKKRFANEQLLDVSVLLFRKNMRNQIL